jgi:hypothetical protein
MLNKLKNILKYSSLNYITISYNSPKPHAFASILLQSRLSLTKIFIDKSSNTHYKEQEHNSKIQNKLDESSINEYKNIIYYPSSSKE